MGGVDSPFFRGNLNIGNYSGFNPGLLHPGLGPPTAPFVSPSVASYTPAVILLCLIKKFCHIVKIMYAWILMQRFYELQKAGKWNAMHVSIAWVIYRHQQKQQADGKSGGVPTKTELLRPSGHLFPSGTTGALNMGGGPTLAPPFSSALPAHPPAPPVSHTVGFLTAPSTHLGMRLFN